MLWRGALLLGTLPLVLGACGHLHMMARNSDVQRPPAEEFGLGPRASVEGLYLATLEPGAPLRPREMRTIQAVLRDAQGRPVDGASIAVDGGMPEHNHGLSTRPRVTRDLGEGTYEIDGVRFNMGGWWEFKLRIEGPAGEDTVTFNLDL